MRTFLLSFCVFAVAAVVAEPVYIDNGLSYDCKGRYDPAKRKCRDGQATAHATFSSALRSAQPGRVYHVRGGHYPAVLHLKVSGTAAAPIIIQAHEGEEVVIGNTSSNQNGESYGPIWFDHVEHNHVIGFTVRGSVGFVRAVGAKHNVIRGNTFDTAEVFPTASKRGGLYFAWSDHNKILDNRIIRGTDSLALVRSSYNVVQGNQFETASHDIWAIKCGSYNVIRGNYFSNNRQKIGAVFDCEEDTTRWHGNGRYAEERIIVDAARHNLIEKNIFAKTSDYYSSSGGNGIQYAGQKGIIRGNIFYQNNIGLGMTHYDPEAEYNHGNRVYNNTFHDNYCAGIALMGADALGRVEDNHYVNNVLWDNQGWGEDNCAGKGAGQIVFRGPMFEGHHLRNNLIASSRGRDVIREEFAAEGWLISDAATEADITDVIEADPRFVDGAKRDYRPADGSPMIDAGAPLTWVAEADGSGRNLAVQDAAFFYDGFGITGEQGDLIRVGDETVRLVGVDYDQNVLSLERAIRWRRGDPVSLDFNGSAPDLGAIER